MRIIEVYLPRTHNLYFFGDDHKGALARYDNGVQKLIKALTNDPIGYGGHMGDGCETLAINHPFYNPASLQKDPRFAFNPVTPFAQVELEAEEFNPVKDKLLWWLQGNHEDRATPYGDLAFEICKRLGKPEIYGGYTAKIIVNDLSGTLMYKIYAFHGRHQADSRAGSERQRETNRAEQLKRVLYPLAGDCIIMAMGHTHRLMAVNPLHRLYIVNKGKKLIQNYITSIQNADYIDPENRFYFNTGSFLRTQMIDHDTYAEKRGYAPVKMGYIKASVKDGVVQDGKEVMI